MEIIYFDEFNKMDFDTKIESSFYDEKKDQIIINIIGDVETFYTKMFTDCLVKMIENEKKLKSIYLNFLKVNYISSSFIALLVHIIIKARMSNISIFFVNTKRFMQDVLDVLGMAHLIKNINLEQNKPLLTLCSACKKPIKLEKAGEFICPSCGATTYISDKGLV